MFLSKPAHTIGEEPPFDQPDFAKNFAWDASHRYPDVQNAIFPLAELSHRFSEPPKPFQSLTLLLGGEGRGEGERCSN
jgi:hypothetical protein